MDSTEGVDVAEETSAESAWDAADVADAADASDDGVPATDVTSETDDVTSESDDGAPETGEIEPARATFAWSPDGVACERCEETVAERWRDGDDFVCADCKDW
jgi:hypothetical protein